MDKPMATYREQRFRQPGAAERRLGLWVDRIGSGASGSRSETLRLLGQYAAVAIDEGAGRLLCPVTGEVPVRAGDVLVLTPQLPTAYWPEASWFSRWVVWNGPGAEELERLGYVSATEPLVHHAANAVNRAFFALVPLLQSEELAAVLQRRIVIETLVLELAHARRFSQQSHAQHDLGERVTAYLQRHFAQALPVATLAAEFGLSPGHFRRLFQAYCGTSPRAYVTGLRMARAKELLASGASIKETATAVGYPDVFYFMRVFRRAVGQPPGAYAAMNHTL